MSDRDALRLRLMRHAALYWLSVALVHRMGRRADAVYRAVSVRACRDLAWAGYTPPVITSIWRAALRGDLGTLPEPTGNVFTRRRLMLRQSELPIEEAA